MDISIILGALGDYFEQAGKQDQMRAAARTEAELYEWKLQREIDQKMVLAQIADENDNKEIARRLEADIARLDKEYDLRDRNDSRSSAREMLKSGYGADGNFAKDTDIGKRAMAGNGDPNLKLRLDALQASANGGNMDAADLLVQYGRTGMLGELQSPSLNIDGVKAQAEKIKTNKVPEPVKVETPNQPKPANPIKAPNDIDKRLLDIEIKKREELRKAPKYQEQSIIEKYDRLKKEETSWFNR